MASGSVLTTVSQLSNCLKTTGLGYLLEEAYEPHLNNLFHKQHLYGI